MTQKITRLTSKNNNLLSAQFYFFRYSQIEQYYHNYENPLREQIKKINTSSLPFGITASVTLSLAASFQQIYVRYIHPTAAIVCSYSALVYFWHQTFLSFKIPQHKGVRAWFRLSLSALSTFIHIVMPITWFPLVIYYPKTHEETLWWTPEEPGFGLYVTGSLMEWVIFTLNELYIASFYSEFKLIQLRKDEIVFL